MTRLVAAILAIFLALPAAESKPAVFGYRFNLRLSDKPAPEPAPKPRPVLPPKHRIPQYTGPVLDQGALGSCGPNAMASIIMSHGYPLPSRLFMYYEAREDKKRDTGVHNESLTDAVTDSGWPDEIWWSYDIAKFDLRPPLTTYFAAKKRAGAEFVRAANGINSLREQISLDRPVLLGFRVFMGFDGEDVRKTGRVPMADPENDWFLGGHDVVAIAYNDDTRLVTFKNSFGERWGDAGYGTLPYEYFEDRRFGTELWVMVMPPAGSLR